MSLLRRLIDRIFPRGALILSVLTFGYFAMGILRNRALSNTFGAGPELDAYNAAFKIPEVALDVLVAAGLTAPFVPIFNGLRERDETAAHDFARTVMTLAVLVMAVVILVQFTIAPATVDWVAGGFDAPTRALYVDLFRLMCVTPILFAASIAVGEVLVAHQQFLFYALAPILYTTGIVLGTVLFGERYGIYATAAGAVAGAAAHLVIRVIGLVRTPFRYRPRLRIRTPAFREFVRLMLPRMVSHPIDPLMLTYFTNLASGLGVGAVSSFNFASDYQVVPVSLIGVSFSLAVFPTLAAAYAAGDGPTFRRVLRRNVVTIGGLTILAAIALAIVARPLVDILLGGGEFGPDDVDRTATVLTAYALSIPFDSLSYPLSRALYATHNTLLQVVASIAGFATVIAAGSLLAGPVGIVAIPLAAAAGGAVKVGLLALFLAPRLRRIGTEGPATVDAEIG
ncbi:MAG TPA: murein biosynthesis integral membrane protein MurJ [Candidatus Limnocylindrales bacterium]|nr:murein biosynthesis integral membrane protein MurJ [Candidatus Limnocylindrales bacterium]